MSLKVTDMDSRKIRKIVSSFVGPKLLPLGISWVPDVLSCEFHEGPKLFFVGMLWVQTFNYMKLFIYLSCFCKKTPIMQF